MENLSYIQNVPVSNGCEWSHRTVTVAVKVPVGTYVPFALEISDNGKVVRCGIFDYEEQHCQKTRPVPSRNQEIVYASDYISNIIWHHRFE